MIGKPELQTVGSHIGASLDRHSKTVCWQRVLASSCRGKFAQVNFVIAPVASINVAKSYAKSYAESEAIAASAMQDAHTTSLRPSK